MSTGRRLFVLDNIDAITLTSALAAYGVLPTWTEAYTMDALLLEGYAVEADEIGPARLTPAGAQRAVRALGAMRAFDAAETAYYTDPAEET